MNCNVIFDSDSSDPCHINSGFDRKDRSRLQLGLLTASYPRVFMNFQTQPMSRAVYEKLVQFVARKSCACRGIHIPAACARPNRRDCRGLRFQDGFIPLPNPFWSSSYVDRPRNIAAIVAEYSTQV